MTQKKQATFDDADIAHAMVTAVLSGLILTLKEHGISPWDLAEALDQLRPPTEKDRLGLDLAKEWIFREFTSRTPPPEVRKAAPPTAP